MFRQLYWQPLPEECSDIDLRGYSTGPELRIVPESGLKTLCQICHSVLTETRKIVRLSDDSAPLGRASLDLALIADWNAALSQVRKIGA